MKRGAVFATYFKADTGMAVRKMEASLGERFPGFPLIAPGLSVDVGAMKGPVPPEEIPRCVEFGKEVASRLDTSLDSPLSPK